MGFRSIVFAAIVVGIISGTGYSIFQQLAVSPIIYSAEIYEVSEPGTNQPESSEGHAKNEADDGDHTLSHDSWAPEYGLERILSTLGANIQIAIGFSLILIAAMAVHNLKSSKPKVTWITGIFWGIGLMLCFFVSPALLGLHPEVPGTIAENLHSRQIWWISCAIATALGLVLIYYGSVAYKLAGCILLVFPHIIGAPVPDGHTYANPDPAAVAALNELTSQFLVMASIGMLIFFIVLGALSGLVSARIAQAGSNLNANQQPRSPLSKL